MKIASIILVLLVLNGTLSRTIQYPKYLEERRGGGREEGGGRKYWWSLFIKSRVSVADSNSTIRFYDPLPLTSSPSNSGGSSRSGSGPRPIYDRETCYAGGSRNLYPSGARWPLEGIAPIWWNGAYFYLYNYHYQYINQVTHHNASIPVVCRCEEYAVCGCDRITNRSYFESLFNGIQPANSNVIKVAKLNGTETISINGTVADPSTQSKATATTAQSMGYWLAAILVVSGVWCLWCYHWDTAFQICGLKQSYQSKMKGNGLEQVMTTANAEQMIAASLYEEDHFWIWEVS